MLPYFIGVNKLAAGKEVARLERIDPSAVITSYSILKTTRCNLLRPGGLS